MKLQHLAVIFILIVLPISLILGSYTAGKMQTLSLQLSYDNKLYNATYDAVKAFQLNTIHSGESNIVDSKLRDIEASVTTFFTSLQNNFEMNGYHVTSLQNYVPAVVFALYDGYYIYTPYKNTIDSETADKLKSNTSYKPNEMINQIKPYVYYSCRYKRGNIDVVITYSLDSYISIKGYNSSGNYINLSGYLLTDVKKEGDIYKYNNVEIAPNETLKEQVIVEGELKTLSFRKINGTKYYYDNGEVFTLTNKGERQIQYNMTREDVENNNSASLYYEQALQLKEAIQSNGLSNLKTTDAVNENGQYYTSLADGETEKNLYGTNSIDIFGELNGGTYKIEDTNSNFYAHKMDVIKHSIERNLSIVIKNFQSTSTYGFAMPKLKDTEWDQIAQNTSVITFLQGLNIGEKIYNGYSIVTNNKNKEFVSEDSIYMVTSDNIYHRIKDSDLLSATNAVGYFNIDFESRAGIISNVTNYYYPQEALGCYHSIVNLDNMQDEKPISETLSGNTALAKAYYTALARERYSIYRIENWSY